MRACVRVCIHVVSSMHAPCTPCSSVVRRSFRWRGIRACNVHKLWLAGPRAGEASVPAVCTHCCSQDLPPARTQRVQLDLVLVCRNCRWRDVRTGRLHPCLFAGPAACEDCGSRPGSHVERGAASQGSNLAAPRKSRSGGLWAAGARRRAAIRSGVGLSSLRSQPPVGLVFSQGRGRTPRHVIGAWTSCELVCISECRRRHSYVGVKSRFRHDLLRCMDAAFVLKVCCMLSVMMFSCLLLLKFEQPRRPALSAFAWRGCRPGSHRPLGPRPHEEPPLTPGMDVEAMLMWVSGAAGAALAFLVSNCVILCRFCMGERRVAGTTRVEPVLTRSSCSAAPRWVLRQTFKPSARSQCPLPCSGSLPNALSSPPPWRSRSRSA